MTIKSRVVWEEQMTFKTEVNGFEGKLDAAEQFGGRNLGPRPKGLLLTSLAGCTAMDVRAILTKMRVEGLTGMSVEAEGEIAEEHPKKFVRILTRFRFEGEDLPEKKLRRAVQLSEERYCGVRPSLDPAIAFTTEIYLNGELLPPPREGAEEA